MTTPNGLAGGSVNNQIGRRVQTHLAGAGMTQGQLAAALGLTQAAVSRKLSGDRPWFADELANVSWVLSVSVGELFGEGQEPQEPARVFTDGRALAGAAA